MYHRLMERKLISILLAVFLGIEGLIFAFGLPPFQKFDELFHFGQSSAIANGCFVNKQPVIPLVYDDLDDNYRFQKVLLENEKYPLSLNNLGRVWSEEDLKVTRSVSKCGIGQIGHIPNGIGVWMSRFTNNPTIIFFVGRLAGFVFFILMFIWSLKLIESKFRYVLWFYALMPMVVHQVTAYSYDVVILSLILPLVALLVNKIVGRKTNLSRELIPWVLVLIIGIIKITYLPLIMLFVLIDWPKNFKRNTVLLMILGLVIATQYGLIKFAKPEVNKEIETSGYSTFVNPTLQRQLITKDPVYFMLVLKNTVSETWEQEFKETVGVFGWRNVPLQSEWVIFVYIIVTIFIVRKLSKDLALKLNLVRTLLSIGVLKIIILLTCVVMYLVWSVVAHRTIHGIQGRYWVPLVPFFLIYISILISQFRDNKFVRLGLVGLMLLGVMVSIFSSIWHRYYDLTDTVTTPVFGKESGKLVIENKNDLVKEVQNNWVFGFTLNLNSGDKPVLVPYKYKVMDKDCKKTLIYGYLSPWDVQGEIMLAQKFEPILISDKKLCLRLETLNINMKDYNVYLTLKTDKSGPQWDWLSYEN